jgi:hypothetical protein
VNIVGMEENIRELKIKNDTFKYFRFNYNNYFSINYNIFFNENRVEIKWIL